jgi:hypothetical protein
MPISKAGKKIKSSLEKQYGKKKGEQVFYAMENKGEIPGMKKMKGYMGGGMSKKIGYAQGGMNEGMKALKKEAPEVAKKMGYAKGGLTKSTGTLNTGIKKCGE